jgi:DNA polymerase I
MPRPVLYLIDASAYVYRAFHALPPLTAPSGLPVHAVYGFTTMLLKLLRQTRAEYAGVVFDLPGPTFRDELFAAYKANRPAMPDGLAAQLPVVREMVSAFALRTLALPGVEADDVIGTVARQVTAAGADTVIVSSDKDLLQLVDEHVSLWDTMRDRRTDLAAVRQRFGVGPDRIVDIMGLMGDPVDNIPGVHGIGEKTAIALIQRFGSVDALLARLDELEAATDVRGARKLAAALRAEAEQARLSRALAVVRRDVPLTCRLEDFRYAGPDRGAVRALFTRLGFQRLLRDMPAAALPTPAPPPVAGAEEWAVLAAAARRHGRLAVAGDGRGARPEAELVGVVAAVPGEPPVYVPATAPLAELLGDPHVEKIAHDLKRDLLLFAAPLAAACAPAFDVMVASYLLEASATHRLEDLAADVVGANLSAFRDGAATLAAGVALLPALRDRFAEQLRSAGMERLFYSVEMPLVAVLADMERRGVRLDVAALGALSRELEARLQALIEEIYRLAGGAFNIASPAQLRAVLFERLGLSRQGVKRGKTGLSTDVDVLSRLAAAHPLPAKVLEYRVLAKLKSTYVDALPAAVNPRTGRLHTSFNQTVAATGRLSSSDPNLQNIPVRGDEGRRIRAAFVAEPGYVLVVADYSQIELRILAHLSGDPVLTAAFRNGEDVHARTAAEVFGAAATAVTPEMRRTAKVINFGILYGMGAARLARELAIPLAAAERYIDSYFERYAGVRAYLEAVQAEARGRGYVTTLLGRRRMLPDLASSHRAVAQAAERTATNTPIQGSAADLIKVAMVAIARELKARGLRAAMLLQVHDELVFEVAEAERETAMALVREQMEHVLPLQVPLRVDVGWGHNWAAAH